MTSRLRLMPPSNKKWLGSSWSRTIKLLRSLYCSLVRPSKTSSASSSFGQTPKQIPRSSHTWSSNSILMTAKSPLPQLQRTFRAIPCSSTSWTWLPSHQSHLQALRSLTTKSQHRTLLQPLKFSPLQTKLLLNHSSTCPSSLCKISNQHKRMHKLHRGPTSSLRARGKLKMLNQLSSHRTTTGCSLYQLSTGNTFSRGQLRALDLLLSWEPTSQ